MYTATAPNQQSLKVYINSNAGTYFTNPGNFGIGTDNPQRKLDVAGDIAAKGIFITHTATTDWGMASLIMVNRDLTKAFVVNSTGSGQNKTVFSILGNGIVNAKKIYAEAFEVNLSAMDITWFDHVFNQDYKLRSLSELEQFIKENKHLPEIPSEKEVKENGLNLGEMQGKLLLKVEELTLYTIEQQKLIEELQKQLKGLQEQINEKGDK